MWIVMKNFSLIRLAAVVLTAILLAGCGAVPLTGRRQMLLVSDQEVYEAGLAQYQEYMKSAKVSSDAVASARVKAVGQKMADATEKYLKANGFGSEIPDLKWEFNLVDNDQVNAFCLPGGKIVVYDALLSVARSEAELAVVIGHEIAHAVAKHSNERMSQQILAQYGQAILSQALSNKSEAVQSVGTSVFGLGAQVGLMLPYSRKHEYEADYMGIVFMEIAGYDSVSAIDFWTKMSSGGTNTNDFLNTHPSDSKRIAEIKRRIPEAKSIAENIRPKNRLIDRSSGRLF